MRTPTNAVQAMLDIHHHLVNTRGGHELMVSLDLIPGIWEDVKFSLSYIFRDENFILLKIYDHD